MTTYAHHPSNASILAIWPTGAGSTAARVTRIPESCDEGLARHLAQALDRLSAQFWTAYLVPDAVAPDAARLTEIVGRPNLPVGTLVRRSEDDLEETAHGIGRLLVRIGDRGCTDAVRREIGRECAAVGSALDGDLTGRARQAVTLVRTVLEPAQRSRAQEVMHAVPMGSERLFTEVGPLAAGVTAFEWLCAALAVTSRHGGHGSLGETLRAAQVAGDDDLRIAVALLEHPTVDSGRLVYGFLRHALLAATGLFPAGGDPEPGIGEVVVSDEDGSGEERMLGTVLDPADPGRSLVEGVLAAIRACFELYLEDTATAEVPDDDPRLTGPHWAEEIRQRFDDEVRRTVEESRRALGA